MAKSNKPIVWGPFAAGGTLTALIMPALILVTLFAVIGPLPHGLTYDGLHAFASHSVAKLAIFTIVSLSLWSSAHRLRITFHDFGARCDAFVAGVVYLIAAVGTLALAVVLIRI
jgi:fumarate reductase subunit D